MGAVLKDSTPVKLTNICQFKEVGVNAGKLKKTRIRFVNYVFATLAVVMFKGTLGRGPVLKNIFSALRASVSGPFLGSATATVILNVTLPFWFYCKLL